MFKYKPPKLECLPLDDGPLRVVCLSPGTMHTTPSTIHNIFNQIAMKSGRLCTVCWTGDDDFKNNINPRNKVQECVDCGLLAHLDCCSSKGVLFVDDDDLEEHRIVLNGCSSTADCEATDASSKQSTASLPDNNTSKQKYTLQHDFQEVKWRCCICHNSVSSSSATESTKKRYMKPRRTRLPSRFAPSGHLVLDVPNSLAGIDSSDRSSSRTLEQLPKNCYLCPHSGGAMSHVVPAPMDDSSDKVSEGSSSAQKDSLWMHEVCRLWCSPILSTISETEATFSTGVCALCGKPGIIAKGNHTVKNTNDNSSSPTMPCHNIDHGNNKEVSSSTADCDTPHKKSFEILVKCAMHGCNVTFHPLCASLVTTIRTFENKFISDSKHQQQTITRSMIMQDEHLCGQFTLQLAEVSRTEGSFGTQIAGETKNSIVPVAFCGLHNPNRERSFLGCPPGDGGVVSMAMRIPTFPVKDESYEEDNKNA